MTPGACQVIGRRMRRTGIESNDFRVGVDGSWAILRWQPTPPNPFAPAWFETCGQNGASTDFPTAPITDIPSPSPSPRKEEERAQPYAAESYSLREFRVNGLI